MLCTLGLKLKIAMYCTFVYSRRLLYVHKILVKSSNIEVAYFRCILMVILNAKFPLTLPPFLKQIRTGLEHLFYLYGMKNELLYHFSSIMHSFVRLSVRLSVCLSVCLFVCLCPVVS